MASKIKELAADVLALISDLDDEYNLGYAQALEEANEEDKEFWGNKLKELNSIQERLRTLWESKTLVIEDASAYDYNRAGVIAFKAETAETAKAVVQQLAAQRKRFRLVIQVVEF